MSGPDPIEVRNFTEAVNAVGERLERLERKFEDGFDNLDAEMRTGFDKIDGRFDNLVTEMRTGFGKVGVGMARITALLNAFYRREEA